MVVLASDDFNRANGALGNAVVGGAWTAHSAGTLGVVSNAAALTAAGAGEGFHTLAPSPRDFDMNADLTSGGLGYHHLIARFIDTSNFYSATVVASGDMRIYKSVAGVSTELAFATTTGGFPMNIRFVGRGGRLQLLKNGVVVLDVTDPSLPLGGRVGIGFWTQSGNFTGTFDNFVVNDLAPISVPPFAAPRRPHQGQEVNWGHPLAQGLASAVLLDGEDGALDLVHRRVWLTSRGNSVQGPSASSRLGGGLATTTPGTTGRMLYLPNFEQLNLTGAFTAIFHKKKLDVTRRGALSLWTLTPAFARLGSGTNWIGMYCPSTDGNAYCYYGGSSGANSLATTTPGPEVGDDVWAMAAGPKGLQMYQNGVLLAGQTATPITRVQDVGASMLGLNCATTDGAKQDLAEHDFLYLFNRQLDQWEIRELSADPFQIIREPVPYERRILVGARPGFRRYRF